MPAQSFGQRLRALRLKAGLTQQQLANALLVDDSYISHLEYERREPSLQTIRSLAHALDVSFDDLLRR